jgi:hypothetical protein
MCSRNSHCCCSTPDSEGGVLSVVAAFFVGVWWLLRHLVAPLVKHVLAPATVFLLIIASRWFSGAALTGRARPATFTRGAVPPARPARRFAVRINWAYWPGWQRAVVRWVATALVVAGLMWPVATIAAVTAVVLTVVAVRFVIARRVRSRPAVLRVTAQVGDRPTPALTADRAAPVWASATVADEAVRS